jgi:hypothetical protein
MAAWPSCFRRTRSASNLTASPLRSNVRERLRPPSCQRSSHLPFCLRCRSISRSLRSPLGEQSFPYRTCPRERSLTGIAGSRPQVVESAEMRGVAVYAASAGTRRARFDSDLGLARTRQGRHAGSPGGLRGRRSRRARRPRAGRGRRGPASSRARLSIDALRVWQLLVGEHGLKASY